MTLTDKILLKQADETIETNLLLTQIKDHLIRPFPDRRLWTPDETCMPFQLSGGTRGASPGAGANVLVRFGVPFGHRGVISRISTWADPTLNPAKNEAKLIIQENTGFIDPQTDDNVCLHITGSLQNVREGGNSFNSNVPGIAIVGGRNEIETRISLMGGHNYTFYRSGSTGTGLPMSIWLFGWNWKDEPRKTN